MKLANQDIRNLMREKKVPVYAVGAAMGRTRKYGLSPSEV